MPLGIFSIMNAASLAGVDAVVWTLLLPHLATLSVLRNLILARR